MDQAEAVPHCANHPERMALERCEVCQTPLCAYCLYYTEDGQRLCAAHAADARARGVDVEEPGAYAEQLIGAQTGVLRKQQRVGDDHLYKGNSNDLLSLLGVVIGLVSVAACCGAVFCLPVVGLAFSLIALLNAKDAHDPRRTRKLGLIGLLLSGVWVLLLAACIALYSFASNPIFSTSFTWWNFTPAPITTVPQTATATPTAPVDLSQWRGGPASSATAPVPRP